MLDELMNIVRRAGTQPVVENPAIPNQHNEAVMQEAGSSIFSKLKDLVSGGNTDALAGMLRGDQSNPAVQDVKNDFAGNINRRLGIDTGAAMNVANNLIPDVLSSLLKGRNGNGQGLNLSAILASLGGGAGQPGMLQSLGNKLGLDKDGDGDVDLNDLKNMFGRK